jgi:hypothetical protein
MNDVAAGRFSDRPACDVPDCDSFDQSLPRKADGARCRRRRRAYPNGFLCVLLPDFAFGNG